MKKIKLDIPFLVAVLILTIGGYLIFASASLGLLSKQPIKYANVAFNQTFLGLFLGSIGFVCASYFNYKNYRKYSLYFFIIACVLTLLVFMPGLGFEHNGASRWIRILGLSFQPSEILKIAYVIFLAAWIAKAKDKVQTFKYGFMPFLVVSAIVGLILLSQPDTDTFVITIVAGVAMYLSGGGRWKHILITGLIGLVLLSGLALTRPYLMNRIMTFVDPSANALSSGWQIQQSLIAIGSGGFFGRGFGQSIQKFNVLPEPIGDSIFAVAGEEFGFIGAFLIISLFIFFAFRGLKIASKVPDVFGRLIVVGIVILITSQAFVNIGAMVGVLPLSGVPLPFISHGGTALFMTLIQAGIVLNISKSRQLT